MGNMYKALAWQNIKDKTYVLVHMLITLNDKQIWQVAATESQGLQLECTYRV